MRKFLVLDLSTNHLPQSIGDALVGTPGVIAYELTHGWLMWVPEDPDEQAEGYRVPAEVLAVQKFARAEGCDYVMFDADADKIDELPCWDW